MRLCSPFMLIGRNEATRNNEFTKEEEKEEE
jgi:hypothetical protein